MSEFYSFSGLRDGGTFVVDSTTKTAIASAPTVIVGKMVTITGNGMAGYGSSGDPVLGIVEQVEKEVTNSNNLVVSVLWHRTEEDIACAGTEAAGNYLAVDGAGGLVKSTTATNCKAIAVDATNKLATIKID